MRFQSYTSTIGTYSYGESWALTTITATTFLVAVKDEMSGIIDLNPQANPEGQFDFAALGKYTESSNDDSADHINQEVADQEVQDNHAFQEDQIRHSATVQSFIDDTIVY